MALFPLVIEKYYKELEQLGRHLKGMFCIQYPIYCIHANISDTTADPLENLDKTVIQFILLKSDFNASQIAGLMGTSRALIEQRISKLCSDNLIIIENGLYKLTKIGREVYEEHKLDRQHKRSYDFYIDGVTLHPLPKIFYSHYRSYFISEYDSTIRINPNTGESWNAKPFGPDLVHTPPDKSQILENIFSVEMERRQDFSIPVGLKEVDEISFTKLSLRILISVSMSKEGIKKELIDGYAIFSLADNSTYYDVLRKNVVLFEKTLSEKIEHLEFNINIPKMNPNKREIAKPVITSNWNEIEKYHSSKNKCFNFSTEDLIRVVNEIFKLNYVEEESLINNEDQIEVSVSRNMLLGSLNKPKLINDLLRGRDYTFGNPDNNVFLLYLYFTSKDSFVNKVVALKKAITELGENPVTLSWIAKTDYKESYRQLFVAAGELELLEQLDIEQHMTQLN